MITIFKKNQKNILFLCVLLGIGLIFSTTCAKSTSKPSVDPDKPDEGGQIVTPPIIKPGTISGLGVFTLTNSSTSNMVVAQEVVLDNNATITARFLMDYEEDMALIDLRKIQIDIVLEDPTKDYTPKDKEMDFSSPQKYKIIDKTTGEELETYTIKVEIALIPLDQLDNDCKVATAEDLKKLRRVKKNQNCIITQNIIITEPFKPIFSFIGNLNGQDKTISIDALSLLTLDEVDKDGEENHKGIGFFRDLEGATVKNLKLYFPKAQNIDLQRYNRIGPHFGLFAGYVVNSEIENVSLNVEQFGITAHSSSTFIGRAQKSTLNNIDLNLTKTIIRSLYFGGLISVADEVTINKAIIKMQNISLDNAESGNMSTASFGIGLSKNNTRIDNLSVTGTDLRLYNGNRFDMGGVIGKIDDTNNTINTINNSKVNLTFSNIDSQNTGLNFGGLVANIAKVNLEITKSSAHVTVQKFNKISNFGGLIGIVNQENQIHLNNTYSVLELPNQEGDITNTGGLVGLITKNNTLVVENSYSVGFEPQKESNGSLLGHKTGSDHTITFKNVYATENAKALGFTDETLTIGKLNKGENPLGDAFTIVHNGYPILNK